jgi:hypothetical protein
MESQEKEIVEIAPIMVVTNVESWLQSLIDEMRIALKKLFNNFINQYPLIQKKEYEKEKLR